MIAKKNKREGQNKTAALPRFLKIWISLP